MVRRRINIVSNLDWVIIGIYLSLIIIGWLNIYSAEFNESGKSVFDLSQRYGKQLLWIMAALVISIIIIIIDSRFYQYFASLLYGLVIIPLILVLVLGTEIHGSRSWFVFGNFHFQPSEFAKCVTGLALARYLCLPNIKLQNFRHLLLSLAIIVFPGILIMLQPDTGSTLVYASLIIVLYREGLPAIYVIVGIILTLLFLFTLIFDKLYIIIALIILVFIFYFFIEKRKRFFFTGITVFIITGGLIWLISLILSLNISIYFMIMLTLVITGIIYSILSYRYKLKYIMLVFVFLIGSVTFTFSVDYVVHNVLKEHQQKRINVLLGLDSDPLGSGYNINQSKIAIGSGGMLGKGYLRGTQTKFNFVPEQSTDFIFCTIGEEWGFAGGAFVVILFVSLLLRILYLAEQQRTRFSRIYGYSVFSILLFHFLVNIGMTIGLFPVIGIPLPFISYGGSSLWGFTILLFIFLRLNASRTEFL